MTETVRGTVTRRGYAAGSKSEHPGLLLTTTDGRTLLLRRRGGHPYADPELDLLDGAAIEATGIVHRDVFLVEGYRRLTG